MQIMAGLEIQKYVAACASRADVRIQWEDTVRPRTDGKVMYLPTPKAVVDASCYEDMKLFVKHETSHVVYSDFSVLHRHKPKGLLMFIDNVIEDHRVDYLNDTEYAGDVAVQEGFFKRFATSVRKKGAKLSAVDKQTTIPLFVWDADVRSDTWYVADVRDAYASHLSKEGHAILAKLAAYSDALKNVRKIRNAAEGSEAGYQLAVRILKEVFGGDEGDYTDEGDDEQPGDDKQPGDEGDEGKGKPEGEGEGEGGSEGVLDKDAKGEAKKTGKIIHIDCKGAELSPYATHTAPGDKGEGVNMTNYTLPGSGYQPTLVSDTLVMNYQNKTTSHHEIRGYLDNPCDSTVRDRITEEVQTATSMANILRTKLQIISRDRWEYGTKKGQLNPSSLYRTCVDGADKSRLFKRQLHNDTLDVCVQLVVDASGSMSGGKFYNAAAASVLLNNTISSILRVPLEVVAFTELYNKGKTVNTMFILKEFDRLESGERMTEGFAKASRHLADNVDGESIVWAYDRIIRRREKRKVMIVLSDGQPYGGYARGNIDKYTRDVIKVIEKERKVEIIGVGLKHPRVADYYTRCAVINKAEEIESKLIELVDKHVFRGV